MVAKMRLVAALGAVFAAFVVVLHAPAPASAPTVELRSTEMPLAPADASGNDGTGASPTTSRRPVLNLTKPDPFDPCRDIPQDVTDGLGLGFTPPEPQDGLRCQYDAGNYQMAVEAFIWRTYEQSLPPDAVETTIGGHRAASFWVMKPTDWNNRWWFSCMIAFKTSYGVIQQSLFFSPKYSPDAPECMQENMMRANQLVPFYKF
ncbi:MAG TPA: DUF3558 family protein [Mycobacterium sp.]|nr:DUF3558 family protein [Mycobacterium sp.]